jgi:hypothetical protein
LLLIVIVPVSAPVVFAVNCTRSVSLLGIECQGKVAPDTLKIPPPTLAVTELIVTAGAIEQAKETYDEFEQVGIRVIDRKEARNTFVKPGSRPNLLQSAALGSASYRSANVWAAKVPRSFGNILGCFSRA